MAYLRCLGFEPCLEWDGEVVLTQLQPVLLLAYLERQGELTKQSVVNTFWPELEKQKGFRRLSDVLSVIDKAAPEVIEVSKDKQRLSYCFGSDLKELSKALEADDFDIAKAIYEQPFLNEFEHHKKLDVMSRSELYEWLLKEREDWALLMRGAALSEAEKHVAQEEFDKALELAEYAQTLRTEQSILIPNDYERLHTIYLACGSSLAAKIQGEGFKLYDEGVSFCKSKQEAIAKLSTPNNLPQQETSLIGRHEALEECRALLALKDVRLVTIVGAGGIGKTHFCTELARSLKGHKDFKDGIYAVWLEYAQSQDDVIQAISKTLNLNLPEVRDPLEALTDALKDKAYLLFLDNFEQLTQHTSVLESLLKTCPFLKILLSSRETLNKSWEHRFNLNGLVHPNTTQARVDFEMLEITEANETEEEYFEKLSNYPALLLFLQEGQKLQKDFTLNKNNYQDIIEICELTEGMPLALKLAAAWLDSTDTKTIAEELKNSLETLDHKQNGISIVFEKSWQRLSEQDQLNFAKLAVFTGGFTLEAVQDICDINLQNLKTLITKSMLGWHAINKRYALHPLLRQFASRKLDTQFKPKAELEEKHAQYYLKELRVMVEGTKIEKTIAPKKLSIEFQNIKQAWLTYASKKPSKLLEVNHRSLLFYCDSTSRTDEAIMLFEKLDETSKYKQTCLKQSIKACLAWFYYRKGNYQKSKYIATEGLALDVSNDCKKSLLLCLNSLGSSAYASGQFQDSLNAYQNLLNLAQSDQAEYANTLLNMSDVFIHLGKYEEAEDALLKSKAIFTREGKLEKVLIANSKLGKLYIHNEQLDKANQIIDSALLEAKELEQKHFIPILELLKSEVALSLNQPIKARELAFLTLKTAKITKRITLQIDAYHQIITIDLNDERYDEAAELIEKSLQITKHYQDQLRYTKTQYLLYLFKQKKQNTVDQELVEKLQKNQHYLAFSYHKKLPPANNKDARGRKRKEAYAN